MNAELAEALFSSHRDEYPELEQASLCQLYQDKVRVFSYVLFTCRETGLSFNP